MKTEQTTKSKKSYNFKVVTELNTAKEEIKALNQKNAELERKNEELTKICKSFAEKTATAERTLANATLEYNARVQYMQDAVQHCMLSIRFAATAQCKENNNGNKF